MVVKIYISGISGNKEVKKRQQRVLMILDSKNVEYQIIDITEPGKEDEKEFMQANSTARDSKHPLPPQIFNNDDYCGDYEDFDLANELDELEKFLKPPTLDDSLGEGSEEKNNSESNNVRQNGNASREASTDKDVSIAHSESESKERKSSMADEDNDDIDKSNSDDIDKTTKSAIDDDFETDEIDDKNEEKSDEQEKEE
ncbi:hypothetical protein PV325_012106 [Microctonus aethiopoides]|uniref:SH3 domain-binding glutamic acid-rich protein homolog n=1 Tax=Microctonus aethiopoides TaxID=144406 RepID=A0AA39KSJ6_9HYME|nr:hypothetical protein PV325_012106 [Microctonus aethiopoides]KAK0172164.1 hypothetical protein PV328_005514 [Microctonus aethiopoides]